MKKAILTTLIAASISSAPHANELGKLKFVSEAPITPATAEKATSVLPVDIEDDITQQVFVDNNIHEIAFLTPEEMADTEGAFLPMTWVAYTLSAGAISGWINHIKHQSKYGEWASPSSTTFAIGGGMLGGAHGKAIVKAANLAGWEARYIAAHGTAIGATAIYANPFNNNDRPTISSSTSRRIIREGFQDGITTYVDY